jgi:uncharacterized membrane protein YozB (DUF420 family)
MSAALLLGGMFYFAQIMSMSSSFGELAPPTIPIIIVYTIILMVVAILCHIATAIFAANEANASSDERERKIFDRAAHLSSYVLATGVVLSLGFYLISYDGNMLFYGVFGSLMISQIAKYAFQVYLYRAGL